MRQLMKVALFSALSFAVVGGVQADEHHHDGASASASAADAVVSPQPVFNGTGEIKDIDLQNKKITISHEAIPAAGWPAMTMRFTYTTQDSNISSLKVGNQVDFSFVQQGNISLLQGIKVRQS